MDFAGGIDEGLLKKMAASLYHRGPDDNGVLLQRNEASSVGLAHARLSILDLSDAGHQPMVFGHLSVVFNGEIYNFQELRAELETCGHAFRTGTDTEVILHAFAEWGIDCVQRFIGMFAFCLHDAKARRVFLVRDRAGVKPLFVYRSQNFWLFASELKAFHECSQFRPEINTAEVIPYFDYGYVPDGRCIFKDCEKVDAGEYWEIDLQTRSTNKHRYWSVYDCYEESKLDITYPEAVEELDRLLHSACNYRLIADVPVGVFLSGGYDSTAVAAILQSGRSSRVSTFTIGFTEGNDEAPFARETARRLGTDHHEAYCSETEAQELIPELATVFDEPFADSSAIPTMLVSKMAREHVKVALSADAGDELFCGYDVYRSLDSRMRRISRIPRPLRPLLRRAGTKSAELLPHTSKGLAHRLGGLFRALSPSDSLTGQKLHAFSRQLPAHYRDNILVEDADSPYFGYEPDFDDGAHGLEGAMAFDYATYLKDDLLVKVDRATMSVGLEGREPLVDHRVLEFAARLPLDFKYDGNVSKKILKAIVHRYLPADTLQRPKTGFSVPIHAWLRGELSGLLDEFCSPAALKATAFLNAPFLSAQVRLFREGKLHYSPLVWRLLMLQMWHRQWA